MIKIELTYIETKTLIGHLSCNYNKSSKKMMLKILSELNRKSINSLWHTLGMDISIDILRLENELIDAEIKKNMLNK